MRIRISTYVTGAGISGNHGTDHAALSVHPAGPHRSGGLMKKRLPSSGPVKNIPQRIQHRIQVLEPGYPIDENHHADVDSVDIDALINAPDNPPKPPTPAADTPGEQEKGGVSMYYIIAVCGGLMAIAAGAYFLSRRRSRMANTPVEIYEEPEEMMSYGDIHTAQGAPGAFC